MVNVLVLQVYLSPDFLFTLADMWDVFEKDPTLGSIQAFNYNGIFLDVYNAYNVGLTPRRIR